MAKRRPAPTQDEINAAIEKAKAGNGRALAEMVKSFSTDDLAKSFSRVSAYGGYGWDTWNALELALSYASGLKSERERWTLRYREILKKRVAAEKAEVAEA